MSETVIIRDKGFMADDWTGGFETQEAGRPLGGAGLDLASDADVTVLAEDLAQIAMMRIDFPSFADGRGFTLAKRLRDMGYEGRLRAAGHVIADQYAMARRSGFDEVEISAELAARQPEADWLARADWQSHDYQSRLRG